MSDQEYPNFAVLLEPFIAQVPEATRPRFLALLERTAAERYRGWAKDIPEHAGGLLACAAREDEIADRIERVFAIDAAVAEQLLGPLPGAREAYYGVFDGLPPWEQLRIQANAERQGAAAWRAIASDLSAPVVVAELERCSALEEESADYLDHLISQRGDTARR